MSVGKGFKEEKEFEFVKPYSIKGPIQYYSVGMAEEMQGDISVAYAANLPQPTQPLISSRITLWNIKLLPIDITLPKCTHFH
jgi:hypothetical protein